MAKTNDLHANRNPTWTAEPPNSYQEFVAQQTAQRLDFEQRRTYYHNLELRQKPRPYPSPPKRPISRQPNSAGSQHEQHPPPMQMPTKQSRPMLPSHHLQPTPQVPPQFQPYPQRPQMAAYQFAAQQQAQLIAQQQQQQQQRWTMGPNNYCLPAYPAFNNWPQQIPLQPQPVQPPYSELKEVDEITSDFVVNDLGPVEQYMHIFKGSDLSTERMNFFTG